MAEGEGFGLQPRSKSFEDFNKLFEKSILTIRSKAKDYTRHTHAQQLTAGSAIT